MHLNYRRGWARRFFQADNFIFLYSASSVCSVWLERPWLDQFYTSLFIFAPHLRISVLGLQIIVTLGHNFAEIAAACRADVTTSPASIPLFTVAPRPSTTPFPWLDAKKCHLLSSVDRLCRLGVVKHHSEVVLVHISVTQRSLSDLAAPSWALPPSVQKSFTMAASQRVRA